MKFHGSKYITEEYRNLLDELSGSSGREAEMHTFLLQRPSLLPGFYGLHEPAHHGVMSGIIFNKLPLQGIFKRVPDFLFVTKTSVQMQVVFIEIEDPSIKIFNKDDSFTKEFNHAFQQLEDWSSWFKQGSNQTILLQTLQGALQWPHMFETPAKPVFILISGRRSEYLNNQNRLRRLAEKNRDPYFTMSFDRLESCFQYDDLIVVKQSANGFEALHVDEFYNYSDTTRQIHGHIANKKDAVLRNVYMNESRKSQIVKDIDYWDAILDKNLHEHIFNLKMKNFPR